MSAFKLFSPFQPSAQLYSNFLPISRASISFQGSECLARPLTNNAADASVKGGERQLSSFVCPRFRLCGLPAHQTWTLEKWSSVFGIDKRLDLATRTLLMRLPAVPDQGQLLSRTLVTLSS